MPKLQNGKMKNGETVKRLNGNTTLLNDLKRNAKVHAGVGDMLEAFLTKAISSNKTGHYLGKVEKPEFIAS